MTHQQVNSSTVWCVCVCFQETISKEEYDRMVSQHQEELQYVQEEYESVLSFFICELECIFILFDLKMHDV